MYANIFKVGLDTLKIISVKRMLLVVALVVVFTVATSPQSAFAFTGDGDPPSLQAIIDVFIDLGKTFIKIMYTLGGLVFIVGTVKGGFVAQTAQQFGISSRMSNELMNMVGGFVMFILFIASLPIANFILEKIGSSDLVQNIEFQVPDINIE